MPPNGESEHGVGFEAEQARDFNLAHYARMLDIQSDE